MTFMLFKRNKTGQDLLEKIENKVDKIIFVQTDNY